ncbi:MAG: hypothetical protein LM586_04480 [Desulfurococcales archaeon]|nr:hypothetical protein [Desulfurococcales archaeon]
MMYRKIFEQPVTYDFRILFHPSYVLPMIDFIGDNTAVKSYGVCSGMRLIRHRRSYEAIDHRSECVDYARYVLGVWLLDQKISEINLSEKDPFYTLYYKYKYYGMAVSPLDDVIIFSTIFLSQNTNYHKNTVKWMRRILSLYKDPLNLLKIDREKIMKIIGRSYQITRLVDSLRCYIEKRDEILKRDVRTLLRCPWIGVKTYFAYRLHVLLDTKYIPLDKNLIRYLSRFFDVKNYKMPRKKLCLIYRECSFCDLRDSCLEASLQNRYKDLGGWLQTLTFTELTRKRIAEEDN